MVSTMSRLQELLKCRESFPYFVTTYVKYLHPMRGLLPMEIHPFQQKLIDNYEQHRHNLVVKFRGSALTTMTQLWALWKAMFYDDQQIMTVGNRIGDAKHVGKIIRATLKRLPDWMVPAMDEDNDERKVFRLTGSVLQYGCCEQVRSKSLTCLILDEAAFIKKLADYWTEMYPSIADGGRVIAVTTTNGIDPWFYETYHRARLGQNAFNIYHPDYWEHPDNNKEWADNMKSSLGEKGWMQEVLGNFLAEGDSRTGD